jgi:glucose-1-phosphate thymidylyltransferase
VKNLKGVILHGGHGTRLRPLTHTGPKQLIPIANKPISQYVLESLRDAGIDDIAIVLGDFYPEKVKEHYGNGKRFGVKITYLHQGKPLGIAHAASLCKDFVGDEKFVVHLGDDLIRGGIKPFAEVFKTSDSDAMVLLCPVDDPQRFGVAQLDNNKKLIKLVEKPKKPSSNFALVGVYFLTPAIFRVIKDLKPSWRGELEITEALQGLLDRGKKVDYQIVDGWWKDTGTVEDILESNRLILDEIKPEIRGKVEDFASIQGRVSVGEDSVVKKGAIIRGPVVIGKNTTISKGSYIGPYTSISDNVSVERGEIENSIIMENCQINIDGRITDSLIGPFSTAMTDHENKPRGYRLIIGERSKIII